MQASHPVEAMSKGLIPLLLSPQVESFGSTSSRNGASLAAMHSTTSILSASKVHTRNSSEASATIELPRPSVRVRRHSQPVPAALPVLPFTLNDWKRAITQIKRYYINRQFRACSARCDEILTNTKDLSTVQPAYLIYLHFYAAASLEVCARPLQPGTLQRTSLLQRAHNHYHAASSLIRQAEEVALSQSRSTSAASSLPSLHSPSDSVSSRGWAAESCVVTPTCSHFRKSSLQQEPRSGDSQRSKKKVSFELPKDADRLSFRLPEPVIRPDSPTLGFEDDYLMSRALRHGLPDLPTTPTKRLPRQVLDIGPLDNPGASPPFLPSIIEDDESSPSSPSSLPSAEWLGSDSLPFSAVDPESAGAVCRYCETLSALKTQVRSHMTSLDKLSDRGPRHLADDQRPESPQPPGAGTNNNTTTTSTIGPVHDPTWESLCRPENLSLLRGGGLHSLCAADHEARLQDRAARINRLRMRGWKRERFDASRYEALCDTALAELEAN